tara:strand:- start:170 stop:799 length:630 start_codon:yes stop_codon:yes gene_type:complete
MKLKNALIAVILSSNIFGNLQEDGEFMNRALYGISENEQRKIQELYKSVEKDLTQLICDGEGINKVRYSDGGETSSEEKLLFRVSLNNRYFFSKDSSQNNWWLWAVYKNKSWINQFPKKTVLVIDDSLVSLDAFFNNYPLGSLDIGAPLNLDATVLVKNASSNLKINRLTGQFSKIDKFEMVFPGKEYADMKNESSKTGKCKILSKRKF